MKIKKVELNIFHDFQFHGKKAQKHIEFIISFVIFVGLLFFMFYVFHPFSKPINPSLIDSVRSGLDKYFNVNLKSISLKIKTTPQKCFFINEKKLIEDLGCLRGNIIVKEKNFNGDESKRKASVSGNKINIEYVRGDEFYTIYCADNLLGEDVSSQCDKLNPDDYSIGIIIERILWDKSKIDSFVYKTNKDDVLSNGNDFAVIIDNFDSNEKIIAFNEDNPIPKGVNSYAETSNVEIINSDANITRNKMTIAVY